MDLGHVAGGAAVGGVVVGDDAAGGVAADARLVSVRLALGIRADDKSVARVAAALSARMGGVSGVVEVGAAFGWPSVVDATRRGAGDCDFVLRAVDDSKLQRVSPVC